jgi:hypothetical protein
MAKAVEKTGKKPPEGKKLISVNVPIPTVEKLQFIAHQEGADYAEVYNKAFDKLIELYEAKFGKIKPKPKGKGLDNI